MTKASQAQGRAVMGLHIARVGRIEKEVGNG